MKVYFIDTRNNKKYFVSFSKSEIKEGQKEVFFKMFQQYKEIETEQEEKGYKKEMKK